MSNLYKTLACLLVASALAACGGGSGESDVVEGGNTDTETGGGETGSQDTSVFLGLSQYDDYLATFSNDNTASSLFVDEQGNVTLVVDTEQHQITFYQSASSEWVEAIDIDGYQFEYSGDSEGGDVRVTTPLGDTDIYTLDSNFSVIAQDISSGADGGTDVGNGGDTDTPDDIDNGGDTDSGSEGGVGQSGLCTYDALGDMYDRFPGGKLGNCAVWDGADADLCNDTFLNESLGEAQQFIQLENARFYNSDSCPELGYSYYLSENLWVDQDLMAGTSHAVPRLSGRSYAKLNVGRSLDLKAENCDHVDMQDTDEWGACIDNLSRSYVVKVQDIMMTPWWNPFKQGIVETYLDIQSSAAELSDWSASLANDIGEEADHYFASYKDFVASALEQKKRLSSAIKQSLKDLVSDINTEQVADDYGELGDCDGILDKLGNALSGLFGGGDSETQQETTECTLEEEPNLTEGSEFRLECKTKYPNGDKLTRNEYIWIADDSSGYTLSLTFDRSEGWETYQLEVGKWEGKLVKLIRSLYRRNSSLYASFSDSGSPTISYQEKGPGNVMIEHVYCDGTSNFIQRGETIDSDVECPFERTSTFGEELVHDYSKEDMWWFSEQYLEYLVE